MDKSSWLPGKFVHLLKYEFHVTNLKQLSSYLTVNTASITKSHSVKCCLETSHRPLRESNGT